MAICQPYAVEHADKEQAEALGRGVVVGDHFDIGRDDNGQPMQIYGLLVVWENVRQPAQSFHQPQELINTLDFSAFFNEDDEEEEETETSEASNETVIDAETIKSN